jgi:hypothetical protein
LTSVGTAGLAWMFATKDDVTASAHALVDAAST